MFRDSVFLNGLDCVARLIGSTKASGMDNHFAKMMRKNNAVKRQLEIQIKKLARSDYYDDAAEATRLANLVKIVEAHTEILEDIQMRMHQEYFGRAAHVFDESLWPLSVKLSTRYQFETGKFGDWLLDTNTYYMLNAAYAKERMAVKRESKSSNGSRSRQGRQKRMKLDPSVKRKYCADCGELMFPCEECGAMIKPCFLKMGLSHICDAVPASSGAARN